MIVDVVPRIEKGKVRKRVMVILTEDEAEAIAARFPEQSATVLRAAAGAARAQNE